MTRKFSFVLAISAMVGCLVCSCADETDTAESCTENDTRCSASGVPQKCVSGQWADQTACSKEQTCQKGSCVDNKTSDDPKTDDKTCTNDKCKAMTDSYSGDVCINDTVIFCGCNSNAECKSGYACNTEHKVCEVYVPCEASACRAKSGSEYVGNVCVTVGTENQCGCNSNTDCNEGYTCKDSKCIDNTSACTASACSDKSDDEYSGNICVTIGNVEKCGCKLTSDCRDGYECNESICTPTDCNPTVCSKTSENYQGNICIEDAYGTKTCGCEDNDDCNTGFTCNLIMGICTASDDGDCDAEACASDVEYYGNACVDLGDGDKVCGCDSDKDCKTGYTCDLTNHGCEIKCLNSSCREMTGEDYQGNVCIDDGTGYKSCGCNSNSDCKEGYSCKEGICVEGDGKCAASTCSAMTGEEYLGNVCIDDGLGGQMCGCETSSDCQDGYTCKSGGICDNPDVCSSRRCKSMKGNDYQGNVCIESAFGNMCGCESNSDCKSGYTCNTTIGICKSTSSDCDAKQCAAASDKDYYGNACIDSGYGEKICGCEEDTDCKTGMECNSSGNCVTKSEKACSKLSFSIPSKVNCENLKSTNGLSDCKEGSRTNTFTLTYSCGAVVELQPKAYTSGTANLRKTENGVSYSIAFSNIASGAGVKFVWKYGTSSKNMDINPMKISEISGSGSKTFIATGASAEMNESYILSKSATGFTFEHGGTGTNTIYLKSVEVAP